MATNNDGFEKKDDKFKRHHKKRVTFGWVIGMLVLLLIGVSFVLAPALGAIAQKSVSTGEIVFGEYNGEKISYARDNYFFDQVQNIAQRTKNTENSQQQVYQVWQQAFNNTVLFTALSQDAKNTGLTATDKMVNKTIIKSGVFDVDGKFSKERYKKANPMFKENLMISTRRDLPYTMVLEDFSKAFAGEKEKQYIVDLAKKQKQFTYVEFGKNAFPNSSVIEYAKNNMDKFSERQINLYSFDTEKEAKEQEEKILNGNSYQDVISSLDNEAVTDLGYLTFAKAKEIANEEDANKIFSTKTNEVCPIIKLANDKYALVQVTSDVRFLDINDEKKLEQVKDYLFKNDSALVLKVLKDECLKVAKENKNNFKKIAKQVNTEVKTTNDSALNIGHTVLYLGLDDTYLSKASDIAKKQIFSMTDTQSKIIEVGKDSVALVKCKNIDGNTTQLNSFYSYYAKSMIQNDLFRTVLNSDKLKNDFINVFFNKIINHS